MIKLHAENDRRVLKVLTNTINATQLNKNNPIDVNEHGAFEKPNTTASFDHAVERFGETVFIDEGGQEHLAGDVRYTQTVQSHTPNGPITHGGPLSLGDPGFLNRTSAFISILTWTYDLREHKRLGRITEATYERVSTRLQWLANKYEVHEEVTSTLERFD